MIRWGRFFLIATPLAVVWGGTHFFLDRGLQRAIEAAGTAAVGARVDVADVDTRLWALTATVRGLAVTDPDSPMTNAVEIGRVRLQLQLKPLFWKKFIVENAELSDIRTGTPRKTSGALPERKKEADEKPSAVESAARQAGEAALANLKGAYDPKELFKPDNLASYKLAMAERDRLSQLATKWKTLGGDMDIKDLSRRCEEFIGKVEKEKFSGVEGIAKAQAYLKEGQKLNTEVSAARKKMRALAEDLAVEVPAAKKTLKEIDRLRLQDLDNALRTMKSGLSTEGFARNLLGAQWSSRLTKGLGWLDRARALAGNQDKVPPPPQRARLGRVVPFPFHHRWPTFHLIRARLSGETPGGLAYTGSLQDVSTDQDLLQKPVTIALTGEKDQGRLELTASLWREKQLKGTYKGFPLIGIRLGQIKDRPLSLDKGTANARFDVTIGPNSSDIKGSVDVEAENLSAGFVNPDEKDVLSQSIQRTLSVLRHASVGIGMGGTVQHPRFDVKTSLDNQLKDALGKALDHETAALRADMENKINDWVGKETDSLSKLINDNGSAALEKLKVGDEGAGGLENKLKKAVDDLTKGGFRGLKTPDLKNIFKKR